MGATSLKGFVSGCWQPQCKAVSCELTLCQLVLLDRAKHLYHWKREKDVCKGPICIPRIHLKGTFVSPAKWGWRELVS